MSLLSKALVICAFVALTLGTYNNVTSNHYVGLFNGALYFPFATAVCQPLNLYGSSFAMYTCVDSSTMKYEAFSDSSCKTKTVSTTITKNTSISAGQYNYFYCSGNDGYYASVALAAEITNDSSAKTTGCTSSNQVTVAAALNACAPTSSAAAKFSVYCDSSHAELQYYPAAYCSSHISMLFSYNAYITCDYLFLSNTTGTAIYIYGELIKCELSGTTSTTTSTTSSTASTASTSNSTASTSAASIHFPILSLILGIIAFIIRA